MNERSTTTSGVADDPELVLITVPHDRVDFTRWLMEAPIGILRAAMALLETGALDTPLACADDADWAAYDGKTADELFTAALRDPAESAWARTHWREWLERLPRPKRAPD